MSYIAVSLRAWFQPLVVTICPITAPRLFTVPYVRLFVAEASSGGHARTPAKLSLHATPRLALILPRIPTATCLTFRTLPALTAPAPETPFGRGGRCACCC